MSEWNGASREEMEAAILRMAIKLGRYRNALEQIDQIATAHKKGAIGNAQAIARDALRLRDEMQR